MNSNKCVQCGLVNFADHNSCRRCGGALPAGGLIRGSLQAVRERGLGRKLLWITGATLTLLLAGYLTLLASSEGLDYYQRQTVEEAIAVLEQAGFSREAWVLRTLVRYRRTDSWWNDYVGHQSAYAATNFPFEIVTLYPPFFDFAVDEVERAAILLHESYHLFGKNEDVALHGVWLAKQRLGWTEEQYSQTRVWKNTREWTLGTVPALFSCGPDRRSDCAR